MDVRVRRYRLPDRRVSIAAGGFGRCRNNLRYAEELDGLSEEAIARATEAATAAGHKGKYLLEQTNTSRPGYLVDLNNRDVRRRVLEASLSCCSSEIGRAHV